LWSRFSYNYSLPQLGFPFQLCEKYYTLSYEAGVDPLIAMKIVGHSNYQTTADVYTHIKEDMLKKSTVNLADVFRKREEMK
jgi:integrase